MQSHYKRFNNGVYVYPFELTEPHSGPIYQLKRVRMAPRKANKATLKNLVNEVVLYSLRPTPPEQAKPKLQTDELTKETHSKIEQTVAGNFADDYDKT